MSARRTPSAWELVHGEPEQVSYWKWRVRRLETVMPHVAICSAILGFAACAVLVAIVRPL